MTTPDFTFAWEHADPSAPWEHLHVVRFHGREEISALYHYDITLLARDTALEVDPHELIGARATLRIATLTEPVVKMHAGRDWNSTVGHDRSEKVANNSSSDVSENRSESTGGDRKTSVKGGNTEQVDGDESVSVGVNQRTSVGADQSVSVGANQSVSVGASQSASVGASRSAKIGADDSLAVGANRAVSVGGNLKESVGGNVKEAVEVGAAGDRESREASTFAEVGRALYTLLERRGLERQAAHVRALLTVGAPDA